MLCACRINLPDYLSNTKQTDVSGPRRKAICDQMNSVLENPTNDPDFRAERARRVFMEQILRYVILEHREKFPELKSTELVKTWERGTGQQW
jgi:hypothetical protein